MILFDLLKFAVFLIIATSIGYALLFSSSLKASMLGKVFAGLVVGLVLITVEVYVLSLFGIKVKENIKALILIEAVISFVFLLRHKALLCINTRKIGHINHWLNTISASSVIILVILAVIIVINSVITIPYGQVTDGGIKFAGVHPTDNSWHLALIHSLEQSIPPENPVYSGETLRNYHYLVDLLIAIIFFFTDISIERIFYQFVGPTFITVYTVFGYLIGKHLSGKRFGGVLAALLLSLSSDWYYLINIVFPSSYKWPSVAWIDYFSSKSVNYPLLFSVIIVFTVLWLLLNVSKQSRKNLCILALLSGVLMGVKSHTAIVFLATLSTMGVINAFRKDWYYLKLAILSGVVALPFLLLTLQPNQQVLLFSPLWFIKVMYEAKDRLNIPDWELRRQYYLATNGYLGIIKLYSQGIIIFTVTNIGPLIFGYVYSIRRMLLKKEEALLILNIAAFFSFGFTMLFIYKGSTIVTIQFFYMVVISGSLLFSYAIGRLSNRYQTSSYILGLLIWISLLPGVIYTLEVYSPFNRGFAVREEIVRGLNYLIMQKGGIVIADAKFSATPLIPAYTGNKIYLADETIVNSLAQNYNIRRKNVDDFLVAQI